MAPRNDDECEHCGHSRAMHDGEKCKQCAAKGIPFPHRFRKATEATRYDAPIPPVLRVDPSRA